MGKASRFRFAATSADLLVLGASLYAVGAEAVSVLIGLAAWVAASLRFDVYRVSPRHGLIVSLRRAIEAWAAIWVVAALCASQALPGLSIAEAGLSGAAALILVRLVQRQTRLPLPDPRPTAAVVGCATPWTRRSPLEAGAGFRFLGRVSLPGEPPPAEEALCSFEDLPRHLASLDRVFLCPSDAARAEDVHRVFDLCDRAGCEVHYFPAFLTLRNPGPAEVREGEGLRFLRRDAPTLGSIAKRLLDIVGAAAGLVLMLPAFLLISLLVKLTSRGPVFYRQTRVGAGGEPFQCFKFRTMQVGAESLQEKLRHASVQDGPAFKIPDDPRVTRVGKVLRKFSLDELPQLLNVLIGDMSLVGPRPPTPSEVANYSWWQRRRISVKPGLTCVWQVWGRNRVSFKRWVEMDLFYIDNRSLWMDLKLILHTVRAVVAGTGM
ncbi:MAG: hypothetical protein Fur0037_20000 [Planctomycetota bacterium]